MYPCGAADTEQRTPFVFSGYSPKCFKLCSEDEQTFMGLERHGGKGLMTPFSFWSGVTRQDHMTIGDHWKCKFNIL